MNSLCRKSSKILFCCFFGPCGLVSADRCLRWVKWQMMFLRFGRIKMHQRELWATQIKASNANTGVVEQNQPMETVAARSPSPQHPKEVFTGFDQSGRRSGLKDVDAAPLAQTLHCSEKPHVSKRSHDMTWEDAATWKERSDHGVGAAREVPDDPWLEAVHLVLIWFHQRHFFVNEEL